MANHIRGEAAIAAAFGRARVAGRAALITYLTAGYPTPEASPALLRALVRGGADVLEIGVPFSDPGADGPAIQAAGQRALDEGMTPRGCLDLVRALRAEGLQAPILLMGYYNPICSWGEARYAHDCRAAGVDGLIVPDLPPEEAGALSAACRAEGLALVYLVAPTTPPERLARIARETRGFLYVISRLGATGADRAPDAAVRERLADVRRALHGSGTPCAVGFGVSGPADVAALADAADGVIVGSAIVERAAEGPAAVEALTRSLAAALARGA